MWIPIYVWSILDEGQAFDVVRFHRYFAAELWGVGTAQIWMWVKPTITGVAVVAHVEWDTVDL